MKSPRFLGNNFTVSFLVQTLKCLLMLNVSNTWMLFYAFPKIVIEKFTKLQKNINKNTYSDIKGFEIMDN